METKKQRKMSMNQQLNNKMRERHNTITLVSAFNRRLDNLAVKYLNDFIENKKPDIQEMCKQEGLSFKKFCDRWYEVKKERFKKPNYNEGSAKNINKYNVAIRNASYNIDIGEASQEDINLYIRSRETIRKRQYTTLKNKYGEDEGRTRFAKWFNEFDKKTKVYLNSKSHHDSITSHHDTNDVSNNYDNEQINKLQKQKRMNLKGGAENHEKSSDIELNKSLDKLRLEDIVLNRNKDSNPNEIEELKRLALAK